MQKFSYPNHLYPFHSKWTNIHGNRIHYIDEGQGETILFCHPPISSSFMFRNMIKELSKRFRCIALDFPGYGLSEISSAKDYIPSINAQSEVVEHFIQRLQLQGVYLLMQECGGHAAMKVFIKYPEKLKGIIITDTVLFPISDYPRIKIMLSIINGGVFNFFNTNFNVLIRAMTRFGFQKRKLSRAERAVYKAMFNSKQIRKTATSMLYQLATEGKLLSHIQFAFETTFNKLPALIIYGRKDPLSAMKIPQRIHSMLTHSELFFIEDEGHFPHEGAYDEMNALITNWFKKN